MGTWGGQNALWLRLGSMPGWARQQYPLMNVRSVVGHLSLNLNTHQNLKELDLGADCVITCTALQHPLVYA